MKHLEINDFHSELHANNVSNWFTTKFADSKRLVPRQSSKYSEISKCFFYLTLKSFTSNFIKTVNIENVIHFKNIKKFELNYISRSQSQSKIPLSFEQLEKFTLKYSVIITTLSPSGIIHEFISIHPSVRKMNISFSARIVSNEDTKKELMNKWSLEDELQLSSKTDDYWHSMRFERNNWIHHKNLTKNISTNKEQTIHLKTLRINIWTKWNSTFFIYFHIQ